MSDALAEIRRRLDEVDAGIVDGLGRRDALIREVARLKVGGDQGVRDLAREQDKLTQLESRAREAGLDPAFVVRMFQDIIEQARRVQEASLDHRAPGRSLAALRVGYQGTEGAYSHLAGLRHFATRDDAVLVGYPSFEEMLEALRAGRLDRAVLPIENTISGSVDTAYELLTRLELSIVGEEVQRVEHCLLALEDVPLSRIRRVFSHPVALAQCGSFLATLADCHVEAFTDTAMAARRVRDERDLSQAAIASEEAGRLYGLAVVKRGVADHRENYTRMAIVAAEPIPADPRLPSKTSLLLATRHEHGALSRVLEVLAEHGLNLTRLESRPRPRTPWEYIFYLDFEGNVADPNVAEALRKAAAHTSHLKVLGSYACRTGEGARPAEPRARTPADGPTPPRPEPADVPVPERKPWPLASRQNRSADTVIRIGTVRLGGGDSAVIIAGPCAVESREQTLACARLVKARGGHMLRGGCFKPRTSPYSFQGLGYEGLDILAEAGAEVGLPIVTEVMHPSDVARVAEKADMLQIGARNMQNFALLKEVGKSQRPVMLKRGLMSSDEWLNAAEYVLAQGNQMVVLCERGIRTFETSTRNTLDLSAVPVLRELTHLPVIVDPSHAVGVRRWVPPLAEAALAVGAHGLMIEIHPDPQNALSDGPQALTFEGFQTLMGRILPH